MAHETDSNIIGTSQIYKVSPNKNNVHPHTFLSKAQLCPWTTTNAKNRCRHIVHYVNEYNIIDAKHQLTTLAGERKLACRGTLFEATISLQHPALAPSTTRWMCPGVEFSVGTSSLAATVLSRSRSALEPITCPRTDAPMVNAIAALGIKMDFLRMAMNGTAACTAANQDGENFSVCSLHTPKGIFAAMPKTPITNIFAGRGCGRKFFAKAVRDRAARAATIAGGHLSFTPGGG